MLPRLGLFLALLAGLFALWILVRAWARLRRAARVNRMREPELSAGRPTILYFTADYCTVCRYRQKPALEALKGALNGSFRLVEMDAVEEAALAKRFGVLSLPTTVVLAADGTVGAVNYGFATRDQLDAQVRSLSA